MKTPTTLACISAFGTLGAKRHLSTTVEEVWNLYAPAPNRVYHAQPHIAHTIDWISKHVRSDSRLGISKPHLIAALFYHDVVNVIGSSTNEKDSAEMADRDMTKMEIDRHHIVRVTGLISCTKHDKEPDTEEGKCMVDADLSSLALPVEEVWNNTLDLWKESGQSAVSFTRCVKTFISMLVTRKSIYYSQYASGMEDVARANLECILGRLNKGLLT